MCIPASAADVAAVNPKGINALFANGLTTFFIKGNLVFNKGPSNLSKKPPHWIILLICALEKFISADVLLLNAFLIFVFFVLLSLIIHVLNYYH